MSSGAPAADVTQNRWVRGHRVLWKRLVDGVIVLTPDADHPFVLSGSGGAVWAALAEPRSLAEVVAHLADSYATDPVTVRRDVAPLVEELAARGGLERVP